MIAQNFSSDCMNEFKVHSPAVYGREVRYDINNQD
jgi:hypothetical protein